MAEHGSRRISVAHPGRKRINATVSWINNSEGTASVALYGLCLSPESLTAEQD